MGRGRPPPRPRRERLLNCSHSQSQNHPVVCVQASPNPEFAANPGNFAHWWMAFVFPLLSAFNAHPSSSDKSIFRSTLLIWHGNNRVLPKWAPHLEGLLGSGAHCRSLSSPAIVGATQAAARQADYRCGMQLRLSVPLFSFRNRSFYQPVRWRAFASVLRTQLAVLGAASGPGAAGNTRGAGAGRVVVLLREGASNRHVEGLDLACGRAAVVCVRPGAREPLIRTAAALADDTTTALLAGHGAALSLISFLPTGSRTFELDHILNIGRARNMYIYLGLALGLDSVKVWLNSTGARFCPERVLACTSAAGGTTVHGCSVGYTGQVLLSAPVLADVLRDATAPRLDTVSAGSTGMAMARACSGVANDTWHGKRWWHIDTELHRPFPSAAAQDFLAASSLR